MTTTTKLLREFASLNVADDRALIGWFVRVFEHALERRVAFTDSSSVLQRLKEERSVSYNPDLSVLPPALGHPNRAAWLVNMGVNVLFITPQNLGSTMPDIYEGYLLHATAYLKA